MVSSGGCSDAVEGVLRLVLKPLQQGFGRSLDFGRAPLSERYEEALDGIRFWLSRQLILMKSGFREFLHAPKGKDSVNTRSSSATTEFGEYAVPDRDAFR